jgi:hypothetical protein
LITFRVCLVVESLSPESEGVEFSPSVFNILFSRNERSVEFGEPRLHGVSLLLLRPRP